VVPESGAAWDVRGGQIDHLARLRPDESANTTEEIRALITLKPALPESGLRKAMEYMTNRWTGLTLFLGNPDIPLSNNTTERAQRGPVIGRKTFYGSHSRRGTDAAALLYSLIESAKLFGINPEAYLRFALQAALNKEEIPLPHEVKDRAELQLPARQ
jgi:transposase